MTLNLPHPKGNKDPTLPRNDSVMKAINTTEIVREYFSSSAAKAVILYI